MGRERQIRILREYIIPFIDRESQYHESDFPKNEHIERAEEILAEAYLDETNIFRTLLIVLAPLVILDSLYAFPAQVYGLVFSMVGTWILLVETDIMGRVSIANQAEMTLGGPRGGSTHLDEREVRRLARQTVLTNVGLIWLTFGFLIQIFAVIFLPGQELII